jgi:5-hydroxyisourate hydrolase
MSLSTHCLDTTTGRPAEGLQVELVKLTVHKSGPGVSADPEVLESATTDTDGRYRFVVDPKPGTYRLRFVTGDYLAAQGRETLYPWVDVTFTVDDPADNPDAPEHLHIPLLLNPFGYSTYRGS